MGGSAPKPPPIVTPPTKTDEQVQQAAAAERARLMAARGRKSTNFTMDQIYGQKQTFGS